MKRNLLAVKMFSVVVAITFLWVNCIWAGPNGPIVRSLYTTETLSAQSQLADLLGRARAVYTGTAYHSALIAEEITDLDTFARLWALASALGQNDEKMRRKLRETIGDRASELKTLIFEDETDPEKFAYYTFTPDGYFYRFTTAEEVNDPFYRLISRFATTRTDRVDVPINGDTYYQEIIQTSTRIVPLVNACLGELYPEGRVHTRPNTRFKTGYEPAISVEEEFSTKVSVETSAVLTEMGLRGAYKRVEEILGEEIPENAKLQLLLTLFQGIKVRNQIIDISIGHLSRIIRDGENIGSFIYRRKSGRAALKEVIKDVADGVAKNIYQQVADYGNVIMMVRVSEGFGRDEVAESLKANEVVLPGLLQGQEEAVSRAITRGDKVYEYGGTQYQILNIIVDVVECTNSFVTNVGDKSLEDLEDDEAGATSVIVTGKGVEDLGNCPDYYTYAIYTTVSKENRQDFVDNPLDPEDIASDPSRIEGVLGRIADANGLTINDLEVVLMDRIREEASLRILRELQDRYEGLEVVTIEDGTVAHGLLATFGRKEGKHKVVLSTTGSAEGFMNLAVAGLFKEEGAVASVKIVSKQVNKKDDGTDATDMSRRYAFTDSEESSIRELRPEDAEDILAGRKLFTQEDVKGDIEGSFAFITNNGVFGVKGAEKLPDGRYKVTVLRVGKVDGKPCAWFEEKVFRLEEEPIIKAVEYSGMQPVYIGERPNASAQKEIFISTGGGAALEFLAEKGRLPVLENLKVDGKYLTVRDIEFNGRRVVVRVDFNVPVEVEFDDKGQIKRITITDDTRIRAALPTIIHILGQNPQHVTLVTHFEPKVKLPGKEKKEKIVLSTEVIAQKLRELLPSIYQDKVVFLTESVQKDGLTQEAIDSITELEGPKVVLLENIRFAEGEKKGSPELIGQLSSLADIYVVDAFGTVHRSHASLLPEGSVTRAVGLLVEKEITYLSKALEPQRPLVLVSGGAKLEGKKGEKGKIDIIKAFLEIMQSGDMILIGGAVAYTFLKAQDGSINLGNSLVEQDKIDLAKQILTEAKRKGIKIILPVDHIAVTELSRDAKGKSIDTPSAEVPEGYMAVDIGVGTIALFLAELDKAQTIVWNGPLGVFEEKQGGFIEATSSLAERLIKLAGTGTDIIVGGGETGEAIKQTGLLETEASKGSHIVRKVKRMEEERILCVMDSIDELKSYSDTAKEMLNRLEHIYGSGIFVRTNEIQIVDDLNGGRLYPKGRAPLASYRDGVLKVDKTLFQYGPWILFEELEHEFLEGIENVVPGSNEIVSDVVATVRNVRRFLDPNLGVTDDRYMVNPDEYRRGILSVLRGANPIDPDGEYFRLLTKLTELQEMGQVSNDRLIVSVVSYVTKTKVYETVRDRLGLPEELAKELRSLDLALDDALSVLGVIASAREGVELVDKFLETEELTVKAIKTFTGLLRVEGISGLSDVLQRMIGAMARVIYKKQILEDTVRDKISQREAESGDKYQIAVTRDRWEEFQNTVGGREAAERELRTIFSTEVIDIKVVDSVDEIDVSMGKKVIFLVDPSDSETIREIESSRAGILYLAMPYTRSSVYMAADIVLAEGDVDRIDPLVAELLRDLWFSEQVFGTEVSTAELRGLLEEFFTEPWEILGRVRPVSEDLNTLSIAARQMEKDA